MPPNGVQICGTAFKSTKKREDRKIVGSALMRDDAMGKKQAARPWRGHWQLPPML
jgi:hypothetical protein